MEISKPIPNAIIFLYDTKSEDILIPDYVDDNLIAFNEKCVSIGTQADGDVTIRLSNRLRPSDVRGCERVFVGDILTPGNSFNISTSQEDSILEIYVESENTKLSIWVDDVDFPALVLIEAA